MAAAAALAKLRGPDLTMDEVALAAGVSRATLYRLFPSRDALLDRVRRAHGVAVDPSDAPARARVFDAVRGLLAREGFGGLVMDRVAAEAGVAPATLYRWFGDKPGLLRAFAASLGVRDVGRALALDDDGDDPRAALGAFAARLLRLFVEQEPVLRLVLAAPKEVAEAVRGVDDVERGTTASLARWIRARQEAGTVREGDADLFATAFLGMLLPFGALPSRGRPRDPDVVGPALAAVFLDGVAARRAAARRRR